MIGRLGWLPSALLVASCAAGGPVAVWRLPVASAGSLAGQVWKLEGDRFAPAAGAVVRAAGREAIADAAGAFAFEGLTAGPCEVTAELTGFRAAPVSCQGPAAGVPVALAPVALATSGEVWVVGAIVDERGVGVPGGTVHAVDTRGGNRRWTADAAGCFAGRVENGVGATVSLMGYGVRADGTHLEGRTIQAIGLGTGPAVPVTVPVPAVPLP